MPTDNYMPISTTFNGQNLEVFNAINDIRLSRNIMPLKAEKTITIGCTKHSYNMFIDGYPNHKGFYQRFTDSYAKGFGEVISYNYITTASIISAYESSPRHYAVLINPIYTHIGIANYNGYQTIDLANYEND